MPSKNVNRKRRNQNEDNEDEQGLLDSATPEEDVSNVVGDARHITAVGEASKRLASENPSTANTTVEAAKDRENQVRDYLSGLRCLRYL